MLIRELIKIVLCLVGGIILAALMPASACFPWLYLLMPVYALGAIYGIGSFGPKIWKLFAGFVEKIFFSIVMKSLIGAILLLVFFPLALALLLTVGWFAGMISLVLRVREAIEAEGEYVSARWAMRRSRRRGPSNDEDDDPYNEEQLSLPEDFDDYEYDDI